MTPPFRPRRGYADGPYGQVHYRDAGEGRPLVLLHQAPLDSRQFDTVLPLLARRGYRGIAIDLPGLGQSDALDHPASIEELARAIPPVLDALGLGRVDLLGHHTGAMVATEVSLQAPDRVAHLILNGPLPLTEDERAALAARYAHERHFKAEPDGSHLATLFAARMARGPDITPEMATRFVLMTLGGAAPFWHAHNAAFTYDHGKTLPRITHPTLLLTNSGDSIYAQAQAVRTMRPDFAYAELEGGGPDIVDQQPEAWTKAVADWLDGNP